MSRFGAVYAPIKNVDNNRRASRSLCLLHDISNTSASLYAVRMWGRSYKKKNSYISHDYLARSAPYERGIVGTEICTYIRDNTRRHPHAWKYESFSTARAVHRVGAVIVFTRYSRGSDRTLNTGFPFLDMRRLWANLYAKLSRAVTHVQKAWTTIKNYIITSSRGNLYAKMR